MVSPSLLLEFVDTTVVCAAADLSFGGCWVLGPSSFRDIQYRIIFYLLTSTKALVS